VARAKRRRGRVSTGIQLCWEKYPLTLMWCAVMATLGVILQVLWH